MERQGPACIPRENFVLSTLPLPCAADLAGAREQAASLTEQLAALAADKSSVEGEQASLAGQLAQLQVRAVMVGCPRQQELPGQRRFACLLAIHTASASHLTFSNLLLAQLRAMAIHSTSSVQGELATLRAEREADATEYERRLQVTAVRPMPVCDVLQQAWDQGRAGRGPLVCCLFICVCFAFSLTRKTMRLEPAPG